MPAQRVLTDFPDPAGRDGRLRAVWQDRGMSELEGRGAAWT